MIVDFQQGIVKYPHTNGTQNFLTVSGGYASISAANGHIDVTFAHGDQNYLHSETTSVPQAWGPLPSNTDCWLYWDINTTSGARTFGFTTVPPAYGSTPPPQPTAGLMWFNTAQRKMYSYTSANTPRVVIRVFAAKVNGSTITPLGSGITGLPFAGSQAGLTLPNQRAGRLIADNAGKPIRRVNGEFFTSEDDFFVNGSPVNAIRLEANILTAVAQEPLARFQVVKFVDFNQIESATYNDTGNTTIAIMMEDAATGNTSTICVQGHVTNPLWSWSQVGAELWISDGGMLTDTDPHLANAFAYPSKRVPVARVVSENSVIFDQGLGGMGERGGPGSITSVPLATHVSTGAVQLTLSADDPLLPLAVGTNDPRLTDKVRISGDVMTGPLTLNSDPTQDMHAATKRYVDAATPVIDLSSRVARAGDNMTGFLTLHSDPALDMHAATKQYVDANSLGIVCKTDKFHIASEDFWCTWFFINHAVGELWRVFYPNYDNPYWSYAFQRFDLETGERLSDTLTMPDYWYDDQGLLYVPSHNRIYTTNGSGRVVLLDATDGSFVSQTTSNDAYRLGLDSFADTVWATYKSNGRVIKLDQFGETVGIYPISNATLTRNVYSMAFDKSHVYVLGYEITTSIGWLHVLDKSTGSIVAEHSLPLTMYEIAYDPKRRCVWLFTGVITGQMTIYRYDVATTQITLHGAIPGTWAYHSTTSSRREGDRYDASTDRFVIGTGLPPNNLYFVDPDNIQDLQLIGSHWDYDFGRPSHIMDNGAIYYYYADGADLGIARHSCNLALPSNPVQPLHAATKVYVDDVASHYVARAGDNMTGFLTLHSDPALDMHAATKQYVDANSLGIVCTTFLFEPEVPGSFTFGPTFFFYNHAVGEVWRATYLSGGNRYVFERYDPSSGAVLGYTNESYNWWSGDEGLVYIPLWKRIYTTDGSGRVVVLSAFDGSWIRTTTTQDVHVPTHDPISDALWSLSYQSYHHIIKCDEDGETDGFFPISLDPYEFAGSALAFDDSFVYNAGFNRPKIFVLDKNTGAPVAEYTLPGPYATRAVQLAYDRSRNCLWVGINGYSPNTGNIWRLDLTSSVFTLHVTLTDVNITEITAGPSSMAVYNPLLDKLVVNVTTPASNTVLGDILYIDPDDPTSIQTVGNTNGGYPWGYGAMFWAVDGNVLYYYRMDLNRMARYSCNSPLPANPVNDLHAVTKLYVDTRFDNINIPGLLSDVGGLTLPTNGLTVTGQLQFANGDMNVAAPGNYTRRQTVTPVPLQDDTVVTIDALLSNNFRLVCASAGATRELANPVNLTNGQVINIQLIQGPTGGSDVTFGHKWKWAGGIPPIVDTSPDAVNFVSAYYDSSLDILISSMLVGVA